MQIPNNRYVTPVLLAILLIAAGCGDRKSNNGGAKGNGGANGKGGGNGNTGGIGKPDDLPLGDHLAAIGHARWYDSPRKGALPVLGFDYRWKDAPPKTGNLLLVFTVVTSDRRPARFPKRYRSISQRVKAAGLAQSGTLFSGDIVSGSFLIAIELHLEINRKAISNVMRVPVPNGTYSQLSTVGPMPTGAVTIGSTRKGRPPAGGGQKMWILKRAYFGKFTKRFTVSCAARPRVQKPRFPRGTTFVLVCHYKRAGGGMTSHSTPVNSGVLYGGGAGREIKTDRLFDVDPESPVEFVLTAKLPDGTSRELAERLRLPPKTNRVPK